MIYQKLSEIQKRLFVPKGQKNNFGGYNYRSCEDIFKAVKPICEECGCVLTVSNDMEQIGDRNYVKATATLVELETGEHLESTAHAREEKEKKGMDGSQITGSASSYARKYALAGLFCIDNEKDSDATNQGEQADNQGEQAEMTLEQADGFTLTSGKYNGVTLGELMVNDKSYVEWLADKWHGKAQQAAKILLDDELRQIAGVKQNG